MSTPPKHRDKIIRAAAVLFRRQGYAASSTNEIVALSGAPKGSLYHYFPQGKEQIATEVVRYAGELVHTTLAQLCQQHTHPADVVRAYGALLAQWVQQSHYRDGCPIATILLEMAPTANAIALAGQNAFATWRNVLATAFEAHMMPPTQAAMHAHLIICTFEGALLVAKTEHTPQPLLDATETLAQLLECTTVT